MAVDGDRVWAGTDNGLGLYEDGKWRSYGVKDGLSYPVVLSLALDPASGDLWAGTMKGLSRYSAGRWEVFTQLNSTHSPCTSRAEWETSGITIFRHPFGDDGYIAITVPRPG